MEIRFVSYGDDKKVDSAVVESTTRPSIQQAMTALQKYIDVYANSKHKDTCQYTKLRATFEPVIAVIYPALWGWTESYEVAFFSKDMLDKHSIEHINFGFPSEPNSTKKRQIYKINGDKAIKIDKF